MFNSLALKNYSVLLLFLFFCLSAGNLQAATVLFDEGHGQVFRIEKNGALDLSSFGELFKAEGIALKINSQQFQDTSFAGIDALVISGPFSAMTPAELNNILQFIQNGGRLCLMLHIPFPVASLLEKLAVGYSLAPVNETENIIGGDTKNFAIKLLQPHPITEGLKSFNVYGTWGVINATDNSTVLASASPKAWIDKNRNNALDDGDGVYPYGVLLAGTLGKGSFAVFGDDAIFQNQFLLEENLQLAINLVRWLKAK
jgi:hypothetical protein